MSAAIKSRVVFLATGNIHKFVEARQILAKDKIAIVMLKKIKTVEIQDDDVENIAKVRVDDAFKKCQLPVAVEDAGLFIKVLDGFPGPYSSYIFKTIGTDGILKLMENIHNRKAHFRSVVAFKRFKNDPPTCFKGEVEGRITNEKRGIQGFGFDPIFKPLNSQKTFSQMTIKEKNQFSHRAASFRKFAKYFMSVSKT
jgi:XTP/dITP diphosphohydrolase